MQTINHVIIHKLERERHGKIFVVERDTALSLTEPVVKLVLDIHEMYANRTSKGYGRFESDEINYPAAKILRDAFKEETIDFVKASKQLLKVLASKASQASAAKGGYVLMAQISNAANASWFITAIINNKNGNVINDNLEVTGIKHVDLENLRVAGRVNLHDWLNDDPNARYIGFLKQRGDVSDYFKLFLGCNELIKNTEETKKLGAALKSFARNEGLDREKEEEFLKLAYNFCHEHTKNDKPLSLDALANAIWPAEPEKLKIAFANNEVEISDGFVPDGRIIKAFVKIKAKTLYWSIDLDRHALVTGDAKYIASKGELVLRNLPTELKIELDNEMSDDN